MEIKIPALSLGERVPDGGGRVRGLFAGDAYIAREVFDTRDFAGTPTKSPLNKCLLPAAFCFPPTAYCPLPTAYCTSGTPGRIVHTD
jgi:hypothetical protein